MCLRKKPMFTKVMIIYIMNEYLLFQICIYRKKNQPAPLPSFGSQTPHFNSECGWNIMEADGKNTNVLCLYIIYIHLMKGFPLAL